MFAEKTAILTAILYTINPLCWMQSERPASDTTGTFFILLSIKFLFSAFDAARYGACTLNYGKNASVSYHLFWRVKKNAHLYGGYCLFFGSLFLGIGLGGQAFRIFPLFFYGWELCCTTPFTEYILK